MTRKHELMIFDCDGVVVDSERIGNRVFGDFLRELGIDLSSEQIFERFLGRALADSVAIVEELIGRPVSSEAIERYKAARNAALTAEVRPVEGVREIICALDIPFCIASSGDHDKMRATLGSTGMMALFEGRIFSTTDVERAKPAPDVYLHAAATMGVDPSRTGVVEDTVNGVLAASAAGMTVYGYAGLTPAASLIEAGADETFTHMRELRTLLDLQ